MAQNLDREADIRYLETLIGHVNELAMRLEVDLFHTADYDAIYYNDPYWVAADV